MMGHFLLKSANQSPLAELVRQAIGADRDEDVEVMTPEFVRPPDWTPAMIPPAATDIRAWSQFSTLIWGPQDE